MIPAAARVLGLNASTITHEKSFAMKPNSSLKRALAAALLAGLLLATTASPAQSTPKPSPPKKSPYSIEIKEGILLLPEGKTTEATLENVVELLRELEQSRLVNPANIVLSPDLPKIKIANLKLTGTMLPQELEALCVASGERFTWGTGGTDVSVDPATGLSMGFGISGQPANPPPDLVPLYILRPAPESGRSRLRVEAFSLAGYFESKRKGGDEAAYQEMIAVEVRQIEEIVAETADIYVAIQREASGGETPRRTSPILRFHRGANLLVVMGEPEAVEMAAKVIGALPHVQRSGGSDGGFGDGMGADPYSSTFRSRYGLPPSSANPASPPSRR